MRINEVISHKRKRRERRRPCRHSRIRPVQRPILCSLR